MTHYRKIHSKSKVYNRKKSKYSKLKPGADAKLNKVFAAIGLPPARPFQPDPFQTAALAAIETADCLVSAPTGSGKTWIAEQAIARIRTQAGQAWYACPLKALSNAKYNEFRNIFGKENVGILTGDRKENPDAPIIVGTTEILRNQLYDAMHRGESLQTDFVVLDEAHFLGDEDRGVVWEEIMIYLPARIPLLLLSATIGNADRIAGWLASIRSKNCEIIVENQRPVPLFPLLLHPSGTLLPLLSPKKSKRGAQLTQKILAFIKAKRPRTARAANGLPPFGQILQVLRKFDLLPAIFFLKSRANCDQAIELCRENPHRNPHRQEQIRRRIDTDAQQSPHITTHRQRWHLEHLAVGSHHSGQLPAWKLVLEKLMTDGLLDAVFATSTVAAGVNFPARTVAFLNSDRFNGRQFLPLTPTEFHQMTGRAGRRGMDKIGFALALPGKFLDVRLIAKLLVSDPSDVNSQIKINFSMALNLLLSHAPDQIEDLLKKSFATYLLRQAGGKKRRNQDRGFLWQDFQRHLNFLTAKNYVTESGDLTEDGKWASQLRVDQPLLIAEGFRRGLFRDSNPSLLAAIIASFVNERETDDHIPREFLPDQLLKTFMAAVKSLKPFAKDMFKHGFEVRPLFLRPAAAAYAWADGGSWDTVCTIAEMEEGNLAMLILRTADNLRHIRNLKKVFPQAAETAAKAIERILREPVVSEEI
jgi:superfamily II RNA helicase